MLGNFNVLIIGGDERYLQVIEQLLVKRANVSLLGYNKIKEELYDVKHFDDTVLGFDKIDAIVLPISGVNELGQVNAIYADKPVHLTEQLIRKTPKHCVIISGISTPYLEELSKTCGRELICIYERDDLAILNSIPTAEGALQLALEHTDYTIHGANVFVLGFGRIGMTISRLFSNVGANVSVAVRKIEHKARITEMRMRPIHTKELKQVIGQADVVINTIGYPILDPATISVMKKETIIIDLASVPGGTDFNYAKENGIKAIHALGLPGKVAPRTAGKVIAEVLIDLFYKLD